MTFYKTSHPGSNSFSQVDYIFTTAKLLSIAVLFYHLFYVTLWNNLNTHIQQMFALLIACQFCFGLFFLASAVLRCTSQN